MDKTTEKIASLCREIQKLWGRDDMLSISIDHNYISFFSLDYVKNKNKYIINHTEFKGAKDGNSNN